MAAKYVLACGLVSCAVAAGASAEVALIDSGTPDESSWTDIWYNPVGNYGTTIALRFDLTAPTRVTRVGLYWGGDADDTAQVLLTDRLGAGATPANLLDTWTLHGTGLSRNEGQWETLAVDRVLDAGMYFVIVTPENSDLNGGWLPTRAPNNYPWGGVFNSVRPSGNNFVPSFEFNPPFEGGRVGFRVLIVPSPGGSGMAALVVLLGAPRRRR